MKPSRFYETPRRRENHIRRLELFALAGESPRAPTRAEMTGPRNRRRANPRVSRRDVSIASGMNDRRALYRYSLRRNHCRARQVTIEAAFPLYGGRDLSLQSRSSETLRSPFRRLRMRLLGVKRPIVDPFSEASSPQLDDIPLEGTR